MRNPFKGFLILGLILFSASVAKAEVSVVDKDGWKFGIGGFVELDSFYDSTRGLTEVVGNNPVARPGTTNGENGSTQFSVRNSRFLFNVVPPAQDEWKTRGYLEFDLMGNQPTVSESSLYTNPTLRLRHGYFVAEKNGWQILAGQTWTLLGWNMQYTLATVSVAPVSGTLYQRTPRVGLLKDTEVATDTSVAAAIALSRPSQRDSRVPNVDAGLRAAYAGRKSGFTSANGDVKTQPLSLAVTGSFREFSLPNPAAGGVNNTTYTPGGAVAIDASIPVLASSDGKDVSNTLTLAGEVSAGKGYGDQFSGWSGNILGLSNSAKATYPNADSSLGGADGTGNFTPTKLKSWNAQLQYHFNSASKTFVTLGYGQLSSSNVGLMTPATATTVIYDRSETYFANLIHDFTNQIRVGVEFDQFVTTYDDGLRVRDTRGIVASYFRF